MGNVLVCSYCLFMEIHYDPGRNFAEDVKRRLPQVDTLLLDLEETEFVEPGTLAAIMESKVDLRQAGVTRVCLLNPGDPLLQIYDICGFDFEFGEPFFSLSEALKTLKKKEAFSHAA